MVDFDPIEFIEEEEMVSKERSIHEEEGYCFK